MSDMSADEIIGWMAYDLSKDDDFLERVRRDNTRIDPDTKIKMLGALLGSRPEVTITKTSKEE